MFQQPSTNGLIVQQASQRLQAYMTQVYAWMTSGLLLTAFIAGLTARSPALLNFVFSNEITFYGLIIVQIGLVLVLSGLIRKLSAPLITTLYMLYSASMGLTLASVFIFYTASSISTTFGVTAGMFGTMSLYGYVTRRNLSGLGSMMFMGLTGVLLATLVNIWLKNTTLMWIVTYIGVVIFVGLIAYDTQKLKMISEQLSSEDKSNVRKYAIMGALTLYLDFINLLLMLLRIFGNRRR
ncbi:Bax inhibitor-1/YccA family protein [Salmonella enterica subsp. enterica serovar Teshie]|uniref:Bax inhibitor-1/YccA family protein n=1 Tax=Salmonella enterica TaxID=28901 RepID=A0A763SV42_SALER|nr:Bax inhibitor-1/YccA family protein [Salmonella enterica]EBR9812250.1 BAX inhibitor (BI)-1/YccA family protein [Salmonella enterica subsp. enterica serovar Teshie]EBU9729348.1 BAX inhibitor (BI)-1/YccA family protein [Salmonella enterica subsp. enterica serovar Teshie]EBV3613894.1 BAX inhibitor (BI)-1/YccA family protein [Salmonella enterica subsp. enterica serovar Teshie]ECB5044498.1 Bax inhibitor-1/YccA family protein [Salmonella enterica subsp. enterica serovar Teshie]ECD2692421.1 Bax in